MEQSQEIRRLLQPGESLLWSGAPAPGIHLQSADWGLIVFSLVWCGFAGFWVYTALTMGAPGFMAVFGLLFLLLGLYASFGRIFRRAGQLKRTHYGVTDRRVILLEDRRTTVLPYDQIPVLEKQVKPGGIGTIYLSQTPVYYTRHGYRQDLLSRTALMNIPDVERVFRLIETNMLQNGNSRNDDQN